VTAYSKVLTFGVASFSQHGVAKVHTHLLTYVSLFPINASPCTPLTPLPPPYLPA
jgi:hypothetical protein